MTNFKRWTPAAIDCYLRGCKCKGCFYEDYFTKGKCQMKHTVLYLVTKLGAPTNEQRTLENIEGE